MFRFRFDIPIFRLNFIFTLKLENHEVSIKNFIIFNFIRFNLSIN